MSKHYLGFSRLKNRAATRNKVRHLLLKLLSDGPHDEATAEAGSLSHADQLERDFAEIERAVVTLRKAEPALEPWAETSVEDPLAVTPSRPPSVWLVIGALWLLLA